jgi:hypothetical protein
MAVPGVLVRADLGPELVAAGLRYCEAAVSVTQAPTAGA